MDFQRILVVGADVRQSGFELADPTANFRRRGGVDPGDMRDFPFAVRPGLDLEFEEISAPEAGIAVEFGKIERFQSYRHCSVQSVITADRIVIFLRFCDEHVNGPGGTEHEKQVGDFLVRSFYIGQFKRSGNRSGRKFEFVRIEFCGMERFQTRRRDEDSAFQLKGTRFAEEGCSPEKIVEDVIEVGRVFARHEFAGIENAADAADRAFAFFSG